MARPSSSCGEPHTPRDHARRPPHAPQPPSRHRPHTHTHAHARPIHRRDGSCNTTQRARASPPPSPSTRKRRKTEACRREAWNTFVSRSCTAACAAAHTWIRLASGAAVLPLLSGHRTCCWYCPVSSVTDGAVGIPLDQVLRPYGSLTAVTNVMLRHECVSSQIVSRLCSPNFTPITPLRPITTLTPLITITRNAPYF